MSRSEYIRTVQNDDPLDTTAQDLGREEKRLKNKLIAVSEIDDLKWLMSSKRGRRIVHRQLASAGVYRISFHTNALQMAFNEGGRNQGLSLLALATEHCPERYADMLAEAKDK